MEGYRKELNSLKATLRSCQKMLIKTNKIRRWAIKALEDHSSSIKCDINHSKIIKQKMTKQKKKCLVFVVSESSEGKSLQAWTNRTCPTSLLFRCKLIMDGKLLQS